MTSVAHPGEDRLIDLASHLLAPEAASETLKHLASCPPCEDRFREICRDAELAKLRKGVVSRAPRWRFAAIAASVIVLTGSIALWTRWGERSMAAAYWFPVDTETVGLRAGTPEGDEKIVHDAVAAYRRHDPARVVGLLHDRTLPEALDPVKIMLASALVKTGEAAKAEALLSELRIETLPQPDRDRASWILLAALEAEGKRAEARAVAEALAAQPGEFSEAARRVAARLGEADE